MSALWDLKISPKKWEEDVHTGKARSKIQALINVTVVRQWSVTSHWGPRIFPFFALTFTLSAAHRGDIEDGHKELSVVPKPLGELEVELGLNEVFRLRKQLLYMRATNRI